MLKQAGALLSWIGFRGSEKLLRVLMSSVRSLLGVCRWQPGLENLARIWGKRMVEMAKVDLPVPSCQKKKKNGLFKSKEMPNQCY